MRASLVLVVAGAAAVAACGVASLERTAHAQEAPREVVSSSSLDETVRDVEIMRRVLVREALSSRTADVEAQNVALSTFWTAAGNSSEAFVVPGVGATFLLRTSDSVAPSKGDEETAGNDKPSAWDEEAAALEGRQVLRGRRAGGEKYEAAKVDALKSRLLEALSKYAAKIRGLSATQRLTVIVVGSGRGEMAHTVMTQGTGLQAVRVYGTGRDDARTVLTMHVSVGDCQAAAQGSLSAEEFKRRVVMAAY